MDFAWLLLSAGAVLVAGVLIWVNRGSNPAPVQKPNDKSPSKTLESWGEGRVTVKQVIYTDPWHAWLARADGGERMLLSKATAERSGISDVQIGETYDARWEKKKGKRRLDVVRLTPIKT